MPQNIRTKTITITAAGTAVGGLTGVTRQVRFVAPGANTGWVKFRSMDDAPTDGRDLQPKESEEYVPPDRDVVDLSRLVFDAEVSGEKIVVVWFEHRTI